MEREIDMETEKEKEINKINAKNISIETIKKAYQEIKAIKQSITEIKTPIHKNNQTINHLEQDFNLGNGVNYII